jgi:hypothetical protein
MGTGFKRRLRGLAHMDRTVIEHHNTGLVLRPGLGP